MTEFLNYRVDLTLKDGSTTTGVISHVDSTMISLGSAVLSTNPQHKKDNLSIESSNIADLRVVQLPPDFKRKNKKNNNNNNNNINNYSNNYSINSNISNNSSELLDDAIVFAKSNYGTPKPTGSRSQTPRLKSAKNYSSTQSNGPDWESDVQEINSNEFDFAANLAMFDKKSVFADLQKRDTIAPLDRLVGHNKVENVTKKKEKFDNDEMILETNKADNWDNIGSKKTSGKSQPAPKSSIADSASSQHLKLVHGNNLSTIPLSSPVQLLEIERLSAEAYGITEPLMAEVCGSNLSQLITNNFLGGSTRLSKKNNHNLPPLVLLLIGSARCGARAFATGRHLTNHGVRVLAFVISNDDCDKDLATQWNLFEKAGGKVISSDVQDLLNIINHQLDTPVELIVDALQGYEDHLEDIFYQEDDQRQLKTLVSWCNEAQQLRKVLSLDIPSGIDGGSGTLLDESLLMSCRWCISMGLPITGLIHAYKNGHLEQGDVLHYLIDVGIPNKVYSSKGNLRKFDKFWYSAESSINLQLSS